MIHLIWHFFAQFKVAIQVPACIRKQISHYALICWKTQNLPIEFSRPRTKSSTKLMSSGIMYSSDWKKNN